MITSILLTFLSLSIWVYCGDLGVWCCLQANTEGAGISSRPGNEPLATRFLLITALSQNLHSLSLHFPVGRSDARNIRTSLADPINITSRWPSVGIYGVRLFLNTAANFEKMEISHKNPDDRQLFTNRRV